MAMKKLQAEQSRADTKDLIPVVVHLADVQLLQFRKGFRDDGLCKDPAQLIETEEEIVTAMTFTQSVLLTPNSGR